VAEDQTREPVRQARGSSGQLAEAGLARELSELARELQAEPALESVLQRIVEAGVREIAAADFAGLSEIDHDRVHTRASTHPVAQQLDEIQYRLGHGPCLTSLRDEVTVRSDDLSTETRWPDFAAAAVENGVRSMLSVQLFVEGDNLGALNLYATVPNAFDDDAESVGILLASHAAIRLKESLVQANLRTALATRDLIGQAKGILMERYKINSLAAFDLLVVASQRTHRKLHTIAEELTATGELPTE
jgi:GAF domain-containing protein